MKKSTEFCIYRFIWKEYMVQLLNSKEMVPSLYCVSYVPFTMLLLYLLLKKKKKRGFGAEMQSYHSWENTKYFC